MTRFLQIVINGETAKFRLPGFVRRVTGSWSEEWRQLRVGVWCAMRAIEGGLVEVELELSNASVTIGQAHQGAVEIQVQVSSEGLAILGRSRKPANFPVTFLMPAKRALCCRFYLGQPRQALPPMRAVAGWRKAFGPARMPMPVPPDNEPYRDRARELALAERSSLAVFENSCTEDGLCPKEVMVDGKMQPFGPGQIGPFHPWGPLSGDAPGGSQIQFGYWREEPEFAHMAHHHVMDRAWVAYKAADGSPLTVTDYLTAGYSRSPDYDGTGSLEPNGELPEFRGKTAGDPLPKPFDNSHSLREDEYLFAAHAQYPTPMTRRHIKVLAEGRRLSFSEAGPVTSSPNYTPINLANLLAIARANPHQGMLGTELGRYLGEILWIYAARLRLDPTIVRVQKRLLGGSLTTGPYAFMRDALELLELCAPGHGVPQRNPFDGINQWREGAWNSPGRDGAQVFEFGIEGKGAMAGAAAIGEPCPDWVLRGAAQISDLPVWLYGGQASFPHFVDVALRGGAPLRELEPAVVPDAAADPACGHFEALCAQIYEMTGDRAWLARACKRGQAVADGDLARKEELLAQLVDKSWTAELQGVLEGLAR